jgi:hypothetical protein
VLSNGRTSYQDPGCSERKSGEEEAICTSSTASQSKFEEEIEGRL